MSVLPRLDVAKDDRSKSVTYTVGVQAGAGTSLSTVTVSKTAGRLRVDLDLDQAIAGQTWQQYCAALEAGVRIL